MVRTHPLALTPVQTTHTHGQIETVAVVVRRRRALQNVRLPPKWSLTTNTARTAVRGGEVWATHELHRIAVHTPLGNTDSERHAQLRTQENSAVSSEAFLPTRTRCRPPRLPPPLQGRPEE